MIELFKYFQKLKCSYLVKSIKLLFLIDKLFENNKNRIILD